MKKRKLLSIVAVSALAAAQMTVPVMAGGGTVNADITTKNAVIRVQVPTKLEVAVDELEIVGDGTQLNSGDFYIKNFSTVPVYVKTTSTVTAGSNATLQDTKEKVVPATGGNGNAWVAVAAKTSASGYGTIADLTDASANVATVDPTSKKAEQEFYLAKSTGNTVYTIVDASTDVPDDLPSYIGEFIELTELTADSAGLAGATESDSTFNAAGADGAANPNNDAILRGLVAAGDVYEDDGTEVTKVVSTDASPATYNSTSTYYSAGDAATSVATGKIYVYAETDAVGGETAFRFIGKLSTGKTGGWTKDDFTSITIGYDITGVQSSAYTTVQNQLTYGLYNPIVDTAPSIATKTYAMTANTPIEITVDLGAGEKAATAVSSVMDPTGVFDYLEGSTYASYDSAAKKLTLKAEMVDACIAADVPSVSVVFNDSDTTTVVITLTK